MSYFIAGLLRPLFWLIVLGSTLWLVRRFCPPSVERVLFYRLHWPSRRGQRKT